VSGNPNPAPIERHPQYDVIVEFARNGPRVRMMRRGLAVLAIATFAGLRYFAPDMPILGAALFAGFFLLPLLFTKTRQRAECALRALERREPVAASLTFEDYDTDWGARFTLRFGADETWRVRMDQSDLAVNDLAREPEHAVTLYRDPASGAPAVVLLRDLLLWQFRAERA
jgi:hypothetical protein